MPAPPEFVAFVNGSTAAWSAFSAFWLADHHSAEELAQEALIRACRDWHKVRDLDRPGAWPHRVAVNLAMSGHRHRRAQQRMLQRLHDRHRTGVDEPDSAVAETIRQALKQLPMDLRAVTVKTRTRRALATLRDGGLIETTEVTDAC
jgi:DNA-directed RNA polymerase specialized sigma24 family protein